MSEQSETGINLKRGTRGLNASSLELIEAMREITEACAPITGRGVGYRLFVAGLIPSMANAPMQRVYRLLKQARERGIIPWEWIVDETRELEQISSWSDTAAFMRTVQGAYRKDLWLTQPKCVEVISEKGTIRGLLQPVLDSYQVGFRVMHGFSSATSVHDIAQSDADRPLILLYVGDYDPSGLYMSAADLPERLRRYGGNQVILKRIALVKSQLRGLPSFPASDKRKDTRYPWFVDHYGDTCWEIDALDPRKLRSVVEKAIEREIEPTAWARAKMIEEAELESIRMGVNAWYGK